ncbi:MAG TPA: hypothetical protein VK401_01645 [Propionibacteriaceae bacterium]|nr:hypothetical protein [Propionibacteriaceae bacterium]
MTVVPRDRLRTVALAVVAVLLALTALWATPPPAYACSCVGASEEQHAASADVIFTGTVAADAVDQRSRTRTLTFTVDRVYKGQASSTQLVTTSSSGASCGLEISGRGPFLVFADQQGSGLTADLCGGTRAGAAPASLGPGQAPPADSEARRDDSRRGTWIPLLALILALGGGTVVGLSLVRRRD